jgi:hypothetical protein
VRGGGSMPPSTQGGESARRSGTNLAFMLSPVMCSSCAARVHQEDNRTTASAATLRTTVAIPTTSMLKARLGLNDMRHRWRQSGGSSIDLDHVCGHPSHHRQRVRAVGRP